MRFDLLCAPRLALRTAPRHRPQDSCRARRPPCTSSGQGRAPRDVGARHVIFRDAMVAGARPDVVRGKRRRVARGHGRRCWRRWGIGRKRVNLCSTAARSAPAAAVAIVGGSYAAVGGNGSRGCAAGRSWQRGPRCRFDNRLPPPYMLAGRAAGHRPAAPLACTPPPATFRLAVSTRTCSTHSYYNIIFLSDIHTCSLYMMYSLLLVRRGVIPPHCVLPLPQSRPCARRAGPSHTEDSCRLWKLG